MTDDARVKSALSHWAPRFVANGVALTDFEEVVGATAGWDDWCRAWSDKAAVHEAMGREALAAGKLHLGRRASAARRGLLSLRQVPVRARHPQMKAAHAKAVDCRRLALPHLLPAGERVAIPFEGRHLYGILQEARAASTRPPVMIMACGLDFGQGGDRGLRGAVPRPWHRHPGVRRPRPGRGRVRLADPRQLRDRGEGRVRLHRDAGRPRHGAHRHVGRKPRRLLRCRCS